MNTRNITHGTSVIRKAKVMHDILEELQDFADEEGTEMGEMLSLIIQLYSYSDYMGDDLVDAVKAELYEQHKYFKENYVYEDKLIQPPIRKVKELVYKGP
jgi:hypothetical protein